MNPTTANRTARPMQDTSRQSIPTTGPDFTIKSGAFGGEWCSSCGDLENEIQGGMDDD